MIEKVIAQEILASAEIESIVLAGVGGAIAYLIAYYQKKYKADGEKTDFKFDPVLLTIQIIMGVFAGYVVQDIVKDVGEYKNLYIALSGFLALPVLKIIESRGAEVVFDFIFKGRGVKK